MERPDYINVIFHILLGTLMLLIGMRVVNIFSEGLTSSLLDVVLIPPILHYICKTTGVTNIVGNQNITKFIIVVCVVALFGVLFSSCFVFTPYLSNNAIDISLHEEHTWAYNSIRCIAEAIQGNYLTDELQGLHLGKYENLFLYYSLMLLFGGYSPFIICIWNTFHLALCCILFVLMANNEGLFNDNNNNLILFICLLMPIFLCTFIYHRDICGQYAVVLGTFLFISTYRNDTASLIAFPIYAFLLYSFRQPYLLIAIAMFFWGVSHRNHLGISRLFSFFVAVFVGLYFVVNTDMSSFFREDMYFGVYGEAYLNTGVSLWQTLMQSLVGYFPWTNLFKDSNWSYHIFACLQVPLNLSIIWHLIQEYKGRFSDFFQNPLLLFGLCFWCFGLIQAGHVTYLTVGSSFFVFGLSCTKISNIYQSFFKLTLFFIVASFLYSVSGLTGSGFLR